MTMNGWPSDHVRLCRTTPAGGPAVRPSKAAHLSYSSRATRSRSLRNARCIRSARSAAVGASARRPLPPFPPVVAATPRGAPVPSRTPGAGSSARFGVDGAGRSCWCECCLGDRGEGDLRRLTLRPKGRGAGGFRTPTLFTPLATSSPSSSDVDAAESSSEGSTSHGSAPAGVVGTAAASGRLRPGHSAASNSACTPSPLVNALPVPIRGCRWPSWSLSASVSVSG